MEILFPTYIQEFSRPLFRQTLNTCNPKPLFKQAVKDWWDVVKTEGLDTNPIFNNDKLASFAALAHGKATRIGCAQKNCNGELYQACVVFGKAPEKNQPIYEKGQGCTVPADCTIFAESKCNAATGLCVAGYIDPAATTSPAPSPTTASTPGGVTTTPAAGTTTSTAPPGKYRWLFLIKGSRYRGATRMCPQNGHISTDAIRNIFLNLHNEHRSNLARGLVKNGNTQSFARQASKMIKLTYDCAAEKSAFAWAQQCKNQDSNTQGVSENRYTFPNKNLDMTVIARRVCIIPYLAFEKLKEGGNGLGYEQMMAWDSTKSFGCAAYKCADFINTVCHYNGGGIEGEQIYKMGPACRRCSTIGTSRCEQGLCVL
ncbi:SCP-like protein [Ancylostoma ceylanicum]|uniref:SCP-like protein n=1 Tax=Ancylostoma ceylanicum TaxID=53326 RepID=A0A0D6LAM5_9BILA|nr:SCP-like protein [Ancylostoma ceylanicum]